MQCCGSPFGPGNHVTWTVDERGDCEFLDELFGVPIRVDAFEDHHDLADAPQPMTGLVRRVLAVVCDYARQAKGLVPVPGSAQTIPVMRADGWEPETETRKFVGYLVTLDTDPGAALLDAQSVDSVTLLLERVAADADRLSLDVVGAADELVRTGIDLLVAGFDTPEVVELAALSPGGRWADTVSCARAAFESIGVPVPPEDEAGWHLALFWAERLTDPNYPHPESAAHRLWGLWWKLNNPDEIGALVPAIEEAEVASPSERGRALTELRRLGYAVASRARTEIDHPGA